MSYTTQLISRWLKHRLIEAIYTIIAAAIVALLLLFLGKVIFSIKEGYLYYWKWSWVGGYGISTLYSLKWIVWRYKWDHKLALHWGTTPEKVFKAVVKYKLFKNESFDSVIKHWDKETFTMRYNIASMVSKAMENL